MAILNLTPDSFHAPSRSTAEQAGERIRELLEQGADMIDIGAVSTRPGASHVDRETEWSRLEPVLKAYDGSYALSIDTTDSEIVRRAFDTVGPFMVNDISAGEHDIAMLPTVGRLGLGYIAMHKRGNPQTMDSHTGYENGVMSELLSYFRDFELRAVEAGISDWVIDPGLGFAKTHEQNWEILEHLRELKVLGRRILVGAADKRFTCGDTEKAHRLAIRNGADILRVHDVRSALLSVEDCRDDVAVSLL